MLRSTSLACGLSALCCASAFAQRVWVLPVVRLENRSSFTEVSTGGYVGAYPASGYYWWATGQDGVRRAYWKFQKGNDTVTPNNGPSNGPNFLSGTVNINGFDIPLTTDDPPEQPRLYYVSTWVPPANSSMFSVLEVDTLGPNNPDPFPIDPRIPWVGASGTNHMYVQRNASNQGTWVPIGPGPDHGIVPTFTGSPGVASAACGTGLASNGDAVWLRRGDWLYVKWDFGNPSLTQGVSAIMITEVNTNPPGVPPLGICSLANCSGQLDLRCQGNADPLYGIGPSDWWDSVNGEPLVEPASSRRLYGVDDWALAAEGYRRPCTTGTMTSPGLPPDGLYTAHLDGGVDVNFRLRYEGFNAFKWDTGQNNPADALFKDRVFTLNGDPGDQFVVRGYNKLYLLSTKNGGSNSQLNVELVYADSSSTVTSVGLYDWFNTDGDGTAVAVGLDGQRRSTGATGFARVRGEDNASFSMDGGNTSGAFFFVHPIDIDPAKALRQIKLSVGPDGRGFGGSIVVFVATLISEASVFDVIGGGVNGDVPDGSVDMNDFGIVQRCYTGPNPVLFDPFNCSCFDVAAPLGQIDNQDMAEFVNCLNYATLPPSPNCNH